MLPENQMNAMRLSPQGASSMVGGMGEMVNSVATSEPPAENPVDKSLEEVSGKFQQAWSNLEFINGKFGGDEEKFRKLQKAAEDWFTSIATNLPQSPQDNY